MQLFDFCGLTFKIPKTKTVSDTDYMSWETVSTPIHDVGAEELHIICTKLNFKEATVASTSQGWFDFLTTVFSS